MGLSKFTGFLAVFSEFYLLGGVFSRNQVDHRIELVELHLGLALVKLGLTVERIPMEILESTSKISYIFFCEIFIIDFDERSSFKSIQTSFLQIFNEKRFLLNRRKRFNSFVSFLTKILQQINIFIDHFFHSI